MPDRLHYRNSSRVQDLMLVADRGYAFSRDFLPRMDASNKAHNRTEVKANSAYGLNGYDPQMVGKKKLFSFFL